MNANKAVPHALLNEDGTIKNEFFVAVRKRGMVNAMLDGPKEQYERENPGWSCRWTYAPISGDLGMVTHYESVGYHTVNYEDLPSNGSGKTGPVRVGDLVLQAAPTVIHEALHDEDARRASEDLNLPATTYRENLEAHKVRRRDGVMDHARPIGTIRQTQQEVKPTNLDSDGGE